jgi:hypothetical protein
MAHESRSETETKMAGAITPIEVQQTTLGLQMRGGSPALFKEQGGNHQVPPPFTLRSS